MTNLIGQNIGRYHIIEQLGQGGMATVYKAYDTRLERDVAIKVIRRQAFSPEIVDRMLKRFEREAKSLAKLNHPNIVNIFDYGEFEGSPYLVMQYIEGGTLKHHLSGLPVSEAAVAQLILPMARALEYAHNKNIVHRDVKPANILVTENGDMMLSDFGIAKLLDSEDGNTLTGTNVGIGTPEYMAPEQSLGKEIDGRADIYSLGVVFYELVTGHKPFTADTPMAVVIKQAHDPLPGPRQYVPKLSKEAERVIYKVLAKNPEDRYQNMGEFADALEKLIRTGSTNGQTKTKLVLTQNQEPDKKDDTWDRLQTPLLPGESRKKKKTIWVYICGGIVLLAVLGGVFLWNSHLPILASPALTVVMETPTVMLPATSTLPSDNPALKPSITTSPTLSLASSTTAPVMTDTPGVAFQSSKDFQNLIKKSQVIFKDNFTKTSSTSWNYWAGNNPSSIFTKNGILTLNGDRETGQNITSKNNLRLNNAFLGDIRFADTADVQIKAVSGDWPQKDWRSWGLAREAGNGNLLVFVHENGLGQSTEWNQENLGTIDGDRWYHFFLWMRNPNTFTAAIWGDGSPGLFYQYDWIVDKDLSDREWNFSLVAPAGKVELTNYQELKMPTGY